MQINNGTCTHAHTYRYNLIRTPQGKEKNNSNNDNNHKSKVSNVMEVRASSIERQVKYLVLQLWRWVSAFLSLI